MCTVHNSIPLLVFFRKKWLRERESKTGDMSDREDSNIKEEQDDREIDIVYSSLAH